MYNFQLYGYQLIRNEDEAIYVAKTKADVYAYNVEHYGEQEKSEAQFIEDLEILDLNSDEVHKVRSLHDDQTGEDDLSSYYSYYQEVALNDQGCTPIIYLTV